MSVNNVYFSGEDIKNGLHVELLNFLLKQSYASDLYNDIHIKPEDCDAFTIEWSQEPWNGEWGGGFKYVDEDQAVLTEIMYPDRTYDLVEDYDEAIKSWSELHPNWHRNEWGIWTEDKPANIDEFYSVDDE